MPDESQKPTTDKVMRYGIACVIASFATCIWIAAISVSHTHGVQIFAALGMFVLAVGSGWRARQESKKFNR